MLNKIILILFISQVVLAQKTNEPMGQEIINPGATSIETPQQTMMNEKVFNEETYEYDPTGKRDPFQSYKGLESEPVKPDSKQSKTISDNQDPLQRFDLGNLSVVAVMWDTVKPKAILKDPSGNLYTVYLKTKVGRNNGYVAVIRESEVVVIEESDIEGRQTHVARVMSIIK